MNEKEIKLKEKDIIFDCEMGEIFMAENYSQGILDSSSEQVRSAFSAIFSDEEKMQKELGSVITSRGWWSENEAKKSEIAKTKDHYTQKQS